MYSANLEKTSKISVHSQRSMHWNCALERCFPSPEERARPPFPARSKPGLISAAPCRFALAAYPARCSEVAPGAHNAHSSHCPPETWGTFGDTASKTPLLSWHNWASSFPVNSSHCLRCKLQSAYPPKRCYVCVCIGLTSPIPWETSKEEGLLEENAQRLFYHQ